jgi:hypothetical protein
MIITYFNKLFVVLVALLIIFASGCGVLIYWLNWPYNPIEIHSIEILNLNKTVEQGGTLAYHIKWTKYTDKQGVVRRYFVNSHKFPLDDDDGSIGSAPKGPGEADIFMPVPNNNPCGKGRMQFTSTYLMNPIRPVTAPIIPAYSDEYTVTARPIKGLKGDTGLRGKTGPEGKGRGFTVFGDVKVAK